MKALTCLCVSPSNIREEALKTPETRFTLIVIVYTVLCTWFFHSYPAAADREYLFHYRTNKNRRLSFEDGQLQVCCWTSCSDLTHLSRLLFLSFSFSNLATVLLLVLGVKRTVQAKRTSVFFVLRFRNRLSKSSRLVFLPGNIVWKLNAISRVLFASCHASHIKSGSEWCNNWFWPTFPPQTEISSLFASSLSPSLVRTFPPWLWHHFSVKTRRSPLLLLYDPCHPSFRSVFSIKSCDDLIEASIEWNACWSCALLFARMSSLSLSLLWCLWSLTTTPKTRVKQKMSCPWLCLNAKS